MNRQDRELLELAAKAVGLTPTKSSLPGCPDYYIRPGCLFDAWNPLTDDGDAHRLAVKLQLVVWNEHVRAGVAYCTIGDVTFAGANSDPEDFQGVYEEVVPADYVATRRAIVQAAAAIGKLK